MVSLSDYPEALLVLDQLLPAVKQILGPGLAGAYVFGSLTSGDFDRDSDVDLLFATRARITPEEFAALQAMHARIARLDVWTATQLEVSYIPLDALRRYDPGNNLHPRLERGPQESLGWEQHDSDWVVQRYQVREKGIVLWGPPPQTLIDPVSAQDLRQAMQALLDDWLAHLHETPEEVGSRGYQSYLVLTVCRVLYTLEHGEVVSKPVAARWAQATLEKRWSGLIERAWLGRAHPSMDPDPLELQQTFEFIDYACARSSQRPTG